MDQLDAFWNGYPTTDGMLDAMKKKEVECQTNILILFRVYFLSCITCADKLEMVDREAAQGIVGFRS